MPVSRMTSRTALVAVAAMVVLAGCGGASGSSTSARSPGQGVGESEPQAGCRRGQGVRSGGAVEVGGLPDWVDDEDA